MIEGVDISRWNATPSFAGLGFCFVRATYGDGVDGRYADHAAAVRRAGIVLGAYHFGRSGQYASITAQVNAFLAVAGGADLLVVDLERDDLRRRNADGTITVIRRTPMSAEEARAFIRAVNARTGKRIGLYHSRSAYPGLGQEFNWIAQWGSEPTGIPWAFWQYSGTGIDRDRYAGTLAQLHTLAGRIVPPTDTGGSTATTDGRRNVAVRYMPKLVTPTVLRVPAGATASAYPGGPAVVHASAPRSWPSLGHAGSINGRTWREVQVLTAWSYSDDKPHYTGLYAPESEGKLGPA